MREQEEKAALPQGGDHRVAIENRKRAVITGVMDVDNFNESEINMVTALGYLTLSGSDLHIQRLNLEEGEVAVEGSILGLAYAEPAQAQSGRFLHRLFR